MADRIFPNTVKDKLDNKKMFTGINWEKVESQVKKLARQAQDMSPESEEPTEEAIDDYNTLFEDDNLDAPKVEPEVKDPEEEEWIDEELRNLDNEIVEAKNYSSQTKTSSDKKQKTFTRKRRPKTSPAKERREDFASSAVKTPRVATKRVVQFTDPSQLSAQAVEAAIKAGDEELKNTILAARHQRRLAIASRIDAMHRAAQKNQNDLIDTDTSDIIAMKYAQDILDQNEEVSSDNYGFKAVSDLNSDERNAFAKFAAKQGFPQEYVQYMLGGGEDPSPAAQSIIELIQNDHLSGEAKVAAVKAMTKTAELSGKDVNYLKNYWLNVLGYDDPAAKEWVDALFSPKYNREAGSDSE